MIDFRTIETFIWVATLRSFRGAAEKLHMTQPAVSMRIAQLESFLGVRLLERDRRLVAPTQKGQELVAYAGRLMRLRAEMIEAVGDRSTMRGIVRLGVSETNKTIALDGLAQWPIITFSRNTQPYIVVRELFARAGLHPTIHASASLATVVRMALDGIGIAVIPPAILHNVAAVGRLRRLKATAKLPNLNFVVGWPAAPDNFAAQKVAEIATQVAKGGSG